MRQGSVVESGDARTVLDNPQHPYSQLSEELGPVARSPVRTGVVPPCVTSRSASIAISRSAPPIRACSAPSSSISAAACMAASTSPAIRPPTPRASARTCWRWCASWRRPSCAIPAATSSPATIGRTASARSQQRPRAARSRLDVDRDQRVRHQRVHRLVPRRRHRADAGGQSRHARRRCRPQHGRVLQPPRRHDAVRPAPHARLGQAARREVLVPRQRDGRAVADGGQDRRRIRPHRRRKRPR